MEQAIEYAVRSGQIRNADSARVSMTGQIRKVTNDFFIRSINNQSVNEGDKYSHNVMQTQIAEEEDEEEEEEGEVEERKEDRLENKSKKFCSESEMNSNKASKGLQSNDGFKQPEVSV